MNRPEILLAYLQAKKNVDIVCEQLDSEVLTDGLHGSSDSLTERLRFVEDRIVQVLASVRIILHKEESNA